MSNFLSPGKMADRLVEKTELDREQCARFSSELFDIIIRELKKEESFSLFGFGTFKKSFVPPSTARNPQTGESVDVPAHFRIKFSPAGKAAERINAEYAHLKPVILETEERVKEGLLLKAERYIMTIQAEPEPAAEAVDNGPVLPVSSGINREENRNEEMTEGSLVSTPESAGAENQKELKPDEQNADEAEPVTITAEPEQETGAESSELAETVILEAEAVGEPDFEFQKDNSGSSAKLIILSLIALILILGIGWLLFRNIGDDGVTEIIVSEAPVEVETPAAAEPPVSPEEPSAAEESAVPSEPVQTAAEALPEVNYNIETGDSFSLLAQRRWGNIYLWPYLYSRNSISFPDPDLVRPGDSIVIPPEPDRTRDQMRIEDSIVFAYRRYRDLIEDQESNPRNPNREISAGYVLLGGERLYPDFLERRKDEIRVEDIRRVQRLGE